MRHTGRGLWKQAVWEPVAPMLTAEDERLLDELAAEIGAALAIGPDADAATVADVETFLGGSR